MHLGLIDGRFVPHNLISTQESPVPLLKFQMALILKILMASGSKKGTQTYFPCLSKVPANGPPPGSSVAPMERDETPEPMVYSFVYICRSLPEGIVIFQYICHLCCSLLPPLKKSISTW